METSSAVWQHRTTAPPGRDATADDDGAHDDGAHEAPAPPAPPDRREVRLGATVAAAVGLALIAVLYVLHAALPATPFRLPFENKRTIQAVVPQGWAFFTLSPRTPDLAVFGTGSAGGWRELTVGSRAVPATAMGWDRRARSQGTEVAILANQLPRESWTSCDNVPLDCLSARSAGSTIVNGSNLRSICGEVGLVVTQALPWAWRDLPTVMPSKVARAVVTC